MAVSWFEKTRKSIKAYVVSKRPSIYWTYRMYRRGWAEPELRVLSAYVKPNSSAIDVGGNHGLYVYYLEPLCAHVHTFEAAPKMAGILRSGYERRGEVTVHEVALSDQAGVAKLKVPNFTGHSGYATIEPGNFFDSKIDVSNGITVIEVPMKTLDQFQFDEISFIKVDVEGHEEKVLRGATETLRRNRPIVVAEVEERHQPNCVWNIDTYMSELGYQTYFLRNERLEPIKGFKPERDQNKSHPDLYVRNFTYIPEELVDDVKQSLVNLGVEV